MDDPNIKCLFHCASAIAGFDVNSIKQCNDLMIFYKILDMSSDKCSFHDINKIISEFFNHKLSDVFNDNDDDETLLKMLLLSIVVYILKSNENNSKSSLMDLCKKIPRDLHPNACAMFAPIIMRYSDGDKVTEDDLEKCLKDCDKENQMMFFSPIKTSERHMLPDQRSHAVQKQKIHQSLKACRNFEQFSTLVDEFYESDTEEQSSFVKLVNYVQSPDYQTTKLMKCNRELGKSVNELEYQLFMSSTFETELDKTISRWKEKCRSLEHKLKQTNMILHSKDDEIMDKNRQIEQLSNVASVNRRLEEKMKDYQDKLTEIQTLNTQFAGLVDENKKLKVENNNMTHYYSLAKQRRLDLETLAKDLEHQKRLNSELTETKERLSKTESQLAELQSCVHGFNGNQTHDSTSDASFNNSFYIPEQMSFIVEKERDELIAELTRLKETSVNKEFHVSEIDGFKERILSAQEEVVNLTRELTTKAESESNVIRFCQFIKEGKEWDGTYSPMVEIIKELCDKHSLEVFNLLESNAIIAREKEDNGKLISQLNQEILEVKMKLLVIETECEGIIEPFDEEIMANFGDFAKQIKQRLNENASVIDSYEQGIASYKNKLHLVNNDFIFLADNLRNLKVDVENLKNYNSSLVDEFVNEISRFKDCAISGDINTTMPFKWLESLYSCYRACITSSKSCEDLTKKYEQATSEMISLQQANELSILSKEYLEKKCEQTIASYEDKLVNLGKDLTIKHQTEVELFQRTLEEDFNVIRLGLIEKHNAEEREMKSDMEKVINDYEECMNQLNKLGLDYENDVKIKDDLISEETRQVNEAKQRIQKLEGNLRELNNTISECAAKYSEKEEKLEFETLLLEESKATCQRQEAEIGDLRIKLADSVRKEEVLTGHIAALEPLQHKLNEVQGLHQASSTLAKELREDIVTTCQHHNIEVLKYQEEIRQREEEMSILSSRLSEKTIQIDQLITDSKCINVDFKKLKEREISLSDDVVIKEQKIINLERDLNDLVKNIDNLKFKVSKMSLENEKLTVEVSDQSDAMDKMKKTTGHEITTLQLQISILKDDVHRTLVSLTDGENKIAVLESTIIEKEKSINDLRHSMESCNGQINSLSTLLMARNTEVEVQETELKQKTLRITKFEEESENDRIRIQEMNQLIEELEEANRGKSVKLSEAHSEISLHKNKIAELDERISRLQKQFDDLVNEDKMKDLDIVHAKASISDFNDKIHSLQSTIEAEMENYEKMNIEYRHAEQESMCYMKKYNDLVKESREEFSAYQSTIDHLTDRIHKIEEERDDQIHEMEKSFNSKIFELQQIVEDSTAEILSMKEESVECRKSQKMIRVQLESEVDRLQKAIQSRESQFHEEKSSLKALLDKERDEKAKYRECYETEIEHLKNKMKCAEEKHSFELDEFKVSRTIIEATISELQVDNYRLKEQITEKETHYQKEVSLLQDRVLELEPMEEKIKQLEEVSQRLMNKVTQLEKSDNVQELQKLRVKNKSLNDYVESLEENISDLKAGKSKVEQQSRELIREYEDMSKINKDLKESFDNTKDQLQNSESRSKSRQAAVENYEREIRALTTDREAMKKRYLMLRDVNERHKVEVERDHQMAVDGYIERIGSLTNDIASFQDQINLLTEEKNTLVEKTYSMKRTVDEQTAKLDRLQKLVWNHSENERRQMLTTFDPDSRYTRMSHWNEKPQLMHQLPPVTCFDRQIVDSMGLNAASRLRFESYVCSPYIMEDEASINITKELLPPPLPPRHTSTVAADSLSQISVPLKKKKDGIRLQLTNRIRKSLNLEPGTQKASSKNSETASESVTSEISIGAGSKPPLPKKAFFSSLKSARKSSQMNVIDISELRQKGSKKDLAVKQEYEDTQITNATPMKRGRHTSLVGSSSVYSLFTKDSDEQKHESNASLKEADHTPEADTHTHFTQSAKTPRANFAIKNLIRRSKNMSPKRKHRSTDSL